MSVQLIIFSTVAFSMMWLIHAYVFHRLQFWLQFKLPRHTWKVITLYAASILLYKFYYESRLVPELTAIMRSWYIVIGWFILGACLFLIADVIRLLTFVLSAYHPIRMLHNRLKTASAGWVMLLLITSLSAYGHYQFRQPITVESYVLHSAKISKPQHIIHMSDLQLGSTSPEYLISVAETITAIVDKYPSDEPILAVLNTGDHVDTSNYTKQQLAPLAFEHLPTLFSLGNHEFYHGHNRLMRILQELGYTILRSSSETLSELNVIGIDDSTNPDQVNRILQNNTALVDKNKFNILMYHRPVGVKDAARNGIDLMLSGHTHGGQFFPFTLVVEWMFGVPQGLSKHDNMWLHLSDGAGLWGPSLRLGTRNELAVISIMPDA